MLGACTKEYDWRCTYVAPSSVIGKWSDYKIKAKNKAKAEDNCKIYEVSTSTSKNACELR